MSLDEEALALEAAREMAAACEEMARVASLPFEDLLRVAWKDKLTPFCPELRAMRAATVVLDARREEAPPGAIALMDAVRARLRIRNASG